MSDVCVISGGGSGIGLAAAKVMSKNKKILISGIIETEICVSA